MGRFQTKKVPLDNSHTRHSYDVPKPDGDLKNTVRSKILQYHRLYLDRPDPIDFLPLAVNTSVRLYDDFIHLLLYTHGETLVLVNELSEESDQFRFLRAASLTNFKGSVMKR